MQSINRKESFPIALFLLILLVPLGKYSIDFGFALKPYMLFLVIFFIIHLSSMQFQRLQLFECGLLLFYIAYCLSGVFALYGSASLRIICGIALYLVCYFLMKRLLGSAKESLIENAISYAGILFNIGNLVFYFLGLKKLNFIMQGDGIYSVGVFMDREYPRLIGLTADPNYLVFYNTIFFTYFLCNLNVKRNRIGLILCILASLLTFSRGGLAAYILIFLLYIAILNNPIKQVKLLIGAFLSVTITLYIAVTFFRLDIYSVIESRMQDFSSDGGSGRFELWSRAWGYFMESPWIGVGASNFLPYNQYQFGDSLQVHNTFLEILSESGALGLFCFSLFLLFVVVQLFQHRVHRTKPYLFLAFFGFIMQMVSLSVIINDLFFMYLALLAVHFHEAEKAFTYEPPKNLLREGVRP
ncbi:O-antigen ligase family protein [Fictibacillus phosphorivorans]|uniref:O-antigen ligase family protein n=1 Tax=Fictibacillus phosphorivorans TaxID=1221500 RepID=UPI00203BF06F|nr:O-antigen ligase family protein [Fictibacillus phosphorivorans]MCM3717691.1 O-antigen ligase family protein [Fictibacillus phosphorivorans]MCM3775591.1 O-antigen ligase family protein [Fictibacillus phosphorivorans]